MANMHIINLAIKCKSATGDGTKIVCMNSDYVVRISVEDCGAFTNSSVKKLIIRHDREYQEVPIVEVEEYGRTYLQAVLPPLSRWDFVDLGVCGKETDSSDAVPTYTSTPARFACDKSVLCGTVVRFSDPTLMSIKITENGTYAAGEHAVDGFSEVNVQVAGGATEKVATDLGMANGDQIILPSKTGLAMSEVVIYKPVSLKPENIVKDVNIGGVVGTFEKRFTETSVSLDGEYTPPEGFDGFSKVVVNVAKNNRERTMRVGQSFKYTYSELGSIYAVVDVSAPQIVQYADDGRALTITAKAIGSCIVKVTKMHTDSKSIIDIIYFDVDVTTTGDITMPVEVSSESEMMRYLERGVAGGVLKYVGTTTDTFTKNSYYLLEEA